MKKNNYLSQLKKRQLEASLRRNVIFGQTLGWVMSLYGAYRYFISFDEAFLFLLLAGNLLLLLGLGIPQSLETLVNFTQRCGSFVRSLLLKALLVLVYILFISPLAYYRKLASGKKTYFYCWHPDNAYQQKISGWTAKQSLDEACLVGKKATLSSSHLAQIFRHFVSNSDLLLMPVLLVILSIGLLAVIIESTPLAPMIYTLF